MPSKGGAPRQLTWHSGHELPFGWSPDGQHIAFGARRNSPNYEIFTVNAGSFKTELICQDFTNLSNIFYLSILFIMFVNFCIGVFHNSSAFIMFTNIDENYRGRLAGLQISSFGLFIVGTIISGGLANIYGPSISTLTSMILIIAASSIIVAKFRAIYSIQ